MGAGGSAPRCMTGFFWRVAAAVAKGGAWVAAEAEGDRGEDEDEEEVVVQRLGYV